MSDALVAITKAKSRRSLFHFTRVRNLPAIAHFDALLSSCQINPQVAGERRLKAMKVKHDEYSITINAHLRIPDRMIDAAITQEQFRGCLDRHVFYWPTKYDSGSSPRFPTHCSYKKSLDMFLPLNRFKIELNNTVPSKASEIREVLIEDRVMNVSKYFLAIYVDHREDAPDCWRSLVRPMADLQDMSARLY